MAFKKMGISKYPPRLWALVGHPGAGKSTFAIQMASPILTIDADHRFTEVAHLAAGDIYQLSDNASDNNDTSTIAKNLDENMPGSDVATIIVDSLTAIISPLVMRAVRDNDAGQNKNRIAAFKDKATAMRQLQFAVAKWGRDVLWIYHLQDGRDASAREVTTATLPQTERNRLHSSLNAELHIVVEGERRGIKIVWARRGRYCQTLWDTTSNYWAGMPEKVEAAIYDGLTEADQERIEREPPPVNFPTPEAAIDWSIAQGVFKNIHHAQNAYDKLKADFAPKTAREMRDLWVNDVTERQNAPMPQAVAVQAPMQTANELSEESYYSQE